MTQKWQCWKNCGYRIVGRKRKNDKKKGRLKGVELTQRFLKALKNAHTIDLCSTANFLWLKLRSSTEPAIKDCSSSPSTRLSRLKPCKPRQKRMGESFMTTVFQMMLNNCKIEKNWVTLMANSRMGPSADPFCLLAVATLPWQLYDWERACAVHLKLSVIHQHGKRPSDSSEAEYVTLVLRMKIQWSRQLWVPSNSGCLSTNSTVMLPRPSHQTTSFNHSGLLQFHHPKVPNLEALRCAKWPSELPNFLQI